MEVSPNCTVKGALPCDTSMKKDAIGAGMSVGMAVDVGVKVGVGVGVSVGVSVGVGVGVEVDVGSDPAQARINAATEATMRGQGRTICMRGL